MCREVRKQLTACIVTLEGRPQHHSSVESRVVLGADATLALSLFTAPPSPLVNSVRERRRPRGAAPRPNPKSFTVLPLWVPPFKPHNLL